MEPPKERLDRIAHLMEFLANKGITVALIEAEYRKFDGSEELSSQESVQEFEQYLFNSAYQMGYNPTQQEKVK